MYLCRVNPLAGENAFNQPQDSSYMHHCQDWAAKNDGMTNESAQTASPNQGPAMRAGQLWGDCGKTAHAKAAVVQSHTGCIVTHTLTESAPGVSGPISRTIISSP